MVLKLRIVDIREYLFYGGVFSCCVNLRFFIIYFKIENNIYGILLVVFNFWWFMWDFYCKYCKVILCDYIYGY